METKKFDEITHKIKKINTKLKEVKIDINNALKDLTEEHEKVSIELEEVYEQLGILKQEIDDINNVDRIERENIANKLIEEINELTKPNYKSNAVATGTITADAVATETTTTETVTTDAVEEEPAEITATLDESKPTKIKKKTPKIIEEETVNIDTQPPIVEELEEEIIEETVPKKKKSFLKLLKDTFTTEVEKKEKLTSFEKFEKEDVDTD